MANYARQRGETLLEVATVAEVNRLCSAGVAPQSAPAPSTVPGANTYTPFISTNQGTFNPPPSCAAAAAGGGSRIEPSLPPAVITPNTNAPQIKRIIDLSRSFPQTTIVF